jgi:hypothetical protein
VCRRWFKNSNLEGFLDTTSLKISLKKGKPRLRWVSQLMTPGRREWDMRTLETCFHNHDIEEIKKIRLWERR